MSNFLIAAPSAIPLRSSEDILPEHISVGMVGQSRFATSAGMNPAKLGGKR